MADNRPPIGTNGIFSLTAPFAAPADISYRVSAIRSFDDLISQGLDPVALIYTPVGLTSTEYQADKDAGAVVVTLLSDSASPIHIPSTYIASYPNSSVVPHSWIVATISCGILPDTYDLTLLKNTIANAVSSTTGIMGTVNIAKAPTREAVTEAQAQAAATARQAAITNLTNDYTEKLALQAQVTSMQAQIDDLLAMIEELSV